MSEYVNAISEDEAVGENAALFEDIRATLGVPVVNLIWRHLATMPGVLPWAWTSVRPLYVSGAVDREADALRGSLDIAGQPGLSAATLRAAGLSAKDLSGIHVVLNSYERSNAMNLVALSALLVQLDKTPDDPKDSPVSQEPAAELSSHRVGKVVGKMPPLAPLDDLTPSMRALVEEMNVFGERTIIMPTMYRHLVNWPTFLALLHVLLSAVAADDRLETSIVRATEDGRRRGESLCAGLANVEAPANLASRDSARTALLAFCDGPIAKMVAIVSLVLQSMPETD